MRPSGCQLPAKFDLRDADLRAKLDLRAPIRPRLEPAKFDLRAPNFRRNSTFGPSQAGAEPAKLNLRAITVRRNTTFGRRNSTFGPPRNTTFETRPSGHHRPPKYDLRAANIRRNTTFGCDLSRRNTTFGAHGRATLGLTTTPAKKGRLIVSAPSSSPHSESPAA